MSHVAHIERRHSNAFSYFKIVFVAFSFFYLFMKLHELLNQFISYLHNRNISNVSIVPAIFLEIPDLSD